MYSIILKKARKRLRIHKRIIENYSQDFNIMKNLLQQPTKSCPWCCNLTREGFVYGDLLNTCSEYCYFSIITYLCNYGSTGLELCLCGDILNIMIKLNKHILTSSSSNYTDDFTFQCMFIGFYTTLSIANKIIDYLMLLDNSYIFCMKYKINYLIIFVIIK